MSVIMTVSQINRYIASRFREDTKLRGKFIIGEISNFTYHTKSGHMYFTLKDSESAIKAVMFRQAASQLKFAPQNGMRVIALADVRVYERDGQYQLYVNDMQPDGVGALYLACEQLKEKLSAEGLFDEEHKKPIPEFPNKIGIITSPEAAALQDILNIISRRYPVAEITIFPALVQGENAPVSICKALNLADSKKMDVLICGRGGGSFEDLSAFNSEAVARCIYSCNTPVISAVGHETDFSIADLAADLRAPTPSGAAELAVPDITTLYGMLNAFEASLNNGFENCLDRKIHRLDIISKRLEAFNPKKRADVLKGKLSAAEKRLLSAYKLKLSTCGGLLSEKAAELESLSPLKTLSRGYSLVYKNSRLINSSKELSAGDNITIQLSDGTVSAEIR